MSDFLFRQAFYDDYKEIKEPHMRRAIFESLCEEGVSGEHDLKKYGLSPFEESLVEILTFLNMESIKSSAERYKFCQKIGRRGGLLGGRGNKKPRAGQANR